MSSVDPVEIIKFIQSEIKMLKKYYEKGTIDLSTLQRSAKHLNNIANFVSTLSKNSKV